MQPPTEPWIHAIDDQDMAFIKRFILASGSLKKVAKQYDISYPTDRLRLDRLIAKIEMSDKFSESGAFERTLRISFADGKIDAFTFRKLLKAYQREQEASDD